MSQKVPHAYCPTLISAFFNMRMFVQCIRQNFWVSCRQLGGISPMRSQNITVFRNIVYKPQHNKTNKMSMRPAKTKISLGIRPVWSESLLGAQWIAKDPSVLHADSEDSDQTGRMPRLIWVFAGRTLILLVLSCHGSYILRSMPFRR